MHAATIGVRGRLIGCVIAMVAIAAMAFAPSASAVEPPVSTYLSLGDSLAFGYTQTKFEENFPNDVPAYFEGGFSDQFARKVRANKEEPANKGLVIVNNGCPGESTDSFISKEAAEAQGEVTCGYQAAGLDLHNGYIGHSQLEDAISVLTGAGKGAPHAIPYVTLDIGSNDELRALHKCEKEVKEEFEKEGKSKYGETPTKAVNQCVLSHAKETFEHIAKNMGTILFEIDEVAKYTGPIVVLGFYNPYTFKLTGSDVLQAILNETIEKEVIPAFPNAKYANPMPIINPPPEGGSKEKAALEKYTEIFAHNDIHPTPAGYRQLGNLLYKDR